MSTIIVYSGGSNTEAVAEYIAQKTGGKAVTVQEASSVDMESFDRIIIGTRVRAGKVPSDLSEYISNNRKMIDERSPAFYLCCLYSGEKGRRQLEKISSELGLPRCVYINKGKKAVKEADSPVDRFIDSL